MLPPLQREDGDTSQSAEDQFRVTVNNYRSKDDNGDQFEDHKSDIQRKIPENAQATTVLVGAHDSLSCIISAFIRLAGGCDLGNFAEVRIPVRFMFVLLGPEDDRMDYHEVGRSISTLMSDKIFLESAYQAKVSVAWTRMIPPRVARIIYVRGGPLEIPGGGGVQKITGA